MFAELTLALSLQSDLKKDLAADTRREASKICESKFEIKEALEVEKDKEIEYERLFRLLLEEVQRQN